MDRIAAIDVGTNSVRLLVADKVNGEVLTVAQELNTTRLGEGIDKKTLLPAAMNRTLQAIVDYYESARKLGAEQFVVVATSAVRDADNREEFVALVRRACGLEVLVLSGDEEASLSYQGALSGLAQETTGVVVLDVGGGSTEFIWETQSRLRTISLQAGAVRMTTVGWSEESLELVLKPALDLLCEYRVGRLIGVGGTITTLAAIEQGLAVYDSQKVHGYYLTAAAVQRVYDLLRSLSVAERQKIPGLQPERADVIVAGVAIVKMILDKMKLAGITASECDILHGLISKKSK